MGLKTHLTVANMSDTEETPQVEQAETNSNTYFTRPSIVKLARKAGVKSLAEDCYQVIDTLMIDSIERFVREGLLVNKVRGAKVLTADDVQHALQQRGIYRTSGDALAFSKI